MGIKDALLEGAEAFAQLQPKEQAKIGPDWADVVATALSLRSKNSEPLIDGTILKTFEKHGINRLDKERQEAYQHLLTALFVFGSAEQKKSAERRQIDLEGGRA